MFEACLGLALSGHRRVVTEEERGPLPVCGQPHRWQHWDMEVLTDGDWSWAVEVAGQVKTVCGPSLTTWLVDGEGAELTSGNYSAWLGRAMVSVCSHVFNKRLVKKARLAAPKAGSSSSLVRGWTSKVLCWAFPEPYRWVSLQTRG